jgi:endonuclease/exonuclease/phosphatase (EEP) superfamily protein YafD
LVLCGVLAATLLMLFARLHWIAGLTTHFIVQYALCALAASVLLAIARCWRWLIAGLLLLALHTALLAPYLPSPLLPANTQPRLRVLSVNVLTQNANHQPILDYALASGADIIGVQEVNDRWVEQLEPLEAEYPYSLKVPRPDNFGIALYSRLPIDNLHVEKLQPHDFETIVGTVQFEGRPIHLRVIHVMPPVGAQHTGARDLQLASIGAWARDNAPCFVFGDFNTAMWSPSYRDFIREGRLANARRRHGILGTWPTGLYPLSIPIDHGLLSPELTAINCQRGTNIGSDHFPLLMDIAFGTGALH